MNKPTCEECRADGLKIRGVFGRSEVSFLVAAAVLHLRKAIEIKMDSKEISTATGAIARLLSAYDPQEQTVILRTIRSQINMELTLVCGHHGHIVAAAVSRSQEH